MFLSYQTLMYPTCATSSHGDLEMAMRRQCICVNFTISSNHMIGNDGGILGSQILWPTSDGSWLTGRLANSRMKVDWLKSGSSWKATGSAILSQLNLLGSSACAFAGLYREQLGEICCWRSGNDRLQYAGPTRPLGSRIAPSRASFCFALPLPSRTFRYVYPVLSIS